MQALIEGAESRPLRPDVWSVPASRPLVWMARGLVDFIACWRPAVAHALLMVVFGWVLLFLLGAHPYYLAAATTGFLLGAPVMTTGIVELSRRIQAEEPTTFNDSLAPLARNAAALIRFGAVLAAIAGTWFVISGAALKGVLHLPPPDLVETFYRGFLDTATRTQLASYVGVGALLALLVFVFSVVTVPAIIDQHMGTLQAMRLSLKVVRSSPMAMVVWSAMLAALTALGFATFLFGMIVVIPLLGHATWHAYRDLVRT